MVRGKILMRIDRVGRKTDNLGASRCVILPAIANRAHLPGANRRFVAGIKQQNHDLTTMVRQPPQSAVAVRQSEVRRRLSFVACWDLPKLFYY